MVSIYCNLSFSFERDSEEKFFPKLRYHLKKLPKLFRRRSRKDDSDSDSEHDKSSADAWDPNKGLPSYLSYTTEETPYDQYLHWANFRLDRVHGEAHLIIQLQDCAHALTQYRLLRDYVPPDQQQPRRKELEEMLSNPRISWKEIWVHIDRERDEEYFAGHEKRKTADTPWLDVVRRVADNVAATPDWHLANAIGEHVMREDVGLENSIEKMVEIGNSWTLRRRVLNDAYEIIHRAFPDSGKGDDDMKAKVRRGIDAAKARYFEVSKDKYGCEKLTPRAEYFEEDRMVYFSGFAFI